MPRCLAAWAAGMVVLSHRLSWTSSRLGVLSVQSVMQDAACLDTTPAPLPGNHARSMATRDAYESYFPGSERAIHLNHHSVFRCYLEVPATPPTAVQNDPNPER